MSNVIKGKKFSIKNIIETCIVIVSFIFVILVIFRKNIFEAGSLMANLYEEENVALLSVKIIKSVVVLMGAIAGYRVIKIALKLVLSKSNRAITAADLLVSLVKYIAAIVVVLMVLSAWGVDTDTLIASAGIVSLIIGLGCQSLVSDIVAGLFIIFEGDFVVGDVVVIGGWRGTVQSIGIRTTKILDASGNVKIINNSNISDIVNNTKELSIAVCDCGVEYGDSIERIEKVIKDNLDYMSKRIPAIVEGPFYKGVESLGDSAVVIRLIAKCTEENKYQVQRDMNRELKIVFDNNKVNIPFPQIVVNQPIDFNEASEHVKKEANDFVDEQRNLTAGMEEREN